MSLLSPMIFGLYRMALLPRVVTCRPWLSCRHGYSISVLIKSSISIGEAVMLSSADKNTHYATDADRPDMCDRKIKARRHKGNVITPFSSKLRAMNL